VDARAVFRADEEPARFRASAEQRLGVARAQAARRGLPTHGFRPESRPVLDTSLRSLLKIERVLGVPIVVLPSVANPRLLRTGAFFASQLDGRLVAGRHARRVVAVDISPAAVRCATVNALLNYVEARIEVRRGDLFAPVARERFDLVLFNPPFLVAPRFVTNRVSPNRRSLSELQFARRAQPQLDEVPWYGLTCGRRILRWLFSRRPRVQTMVSVRAAPESAGVGATKAAG
jgi:hypothetical protein